MNRLPIVVIFLLLLGCQETDTKSSPEYFDLKAYFEEEANRLTKLNPTVRKQVKRNEISENKTRSEISWKNELALFVESDINKPAWKNSYRVSRSGYTSVYAATDSSMRTRSVTVKTNTDGSVASVLISNRSKNLLYQATEILSYYPDSLYLILKDQKVLLLGGNTYEIRGEF